MPQLPCSLRINTEDSKHCGYGAPESQGGEADCVSTEIKDIDTRARTQAKGGEEDTIYDVVADTEHSVALRPINCNVADAVVPLDSLKKDAFVKIRVFRLTHFCSINDKCEQELRDVNSGSLLWAIAGTSMNGRYQPYHSLDYCMVHIIRVKVNDLRSEGYLQFEDGSPTRCPPNIRGYLGCEIRCDRDRAGSRPYVWFSTADMHWEDYKEASKPPDSVRSDAFFEEFGWQHVCVESCIPGKMLYEAWQKLGASMDEETASRVVEVALRDVLAQVPGDNTPSPPVSPKSKEKRRRKFT